MRVIFIVGFIVLIIAVTGFYEYFSPDKPKSKDIPK
jgi:hypothetical protein